MNLVTRKILKTLHHIKLIRLNHTAIVNNFYDRNLSKTQIKNALINTRFLQTEKATKCTLFFNYFLSNKIYKS